MFFAVIIIITAYLPIFTLQRVEGRLFTPMAWTVAFALLGRAALRAGARAGAGQLSSCARTSRSGTTRCSTGLTRRYRRALGWCLRHRWLTIGAAGGVLASHAAHRHRAASSAPSFCPTSTRAPSGRAARCRPAPVPQGERSMAQARLVLAGFPGGDAGGVPGGPPRRRHRRDRLLQHRVLRRPQAARGVAPAVSRNKEELIAAMDAELEKIPGRHLELLAAHRGQHGGGGERREGRAGGEDLSATT